MNTSEARSVLEGTLAKYRAKSYQELSGRISAPTERLKITGRSGVSYQVTIRAFWDGRPNYDIRVIGCIDDGGWRAFLPLSDSFIKASDESFVGEARTAAVDPNRDLWRDLYSRIRRVLSFYRRR